MKRLLFSLVALVSLHSYAKADAPSNALEMPKMSWSLPLGIGTVNLPFQAHELVGGYDFLLHDTIAGYSTPVCKLWKEIDGSIGVVGVARASAIEPYVAAGVDVAQHLPQLQDLTSLHLNAFVRYDTAVGKPGAGLTASYWF